MIGIGSLVYVVNVLPFAYLILSPLIFRRYNYLGINPYSNSRNYYKRFWFRAIFGRFQIPLYILGGGFYSMFLLKSHLNDKTDLLDFTAFTVENEDFQEELSPYHAKSVAVFKYNKLMDDSKNKVLQERAELHRENKLRAFEEYQKESMEKENKL